jgi:hypothetical protein
MNTHEIVNALESEIARLQHVRAVISGENGVKRRGRPPASALVAKKKRTLSPAARKKIAAAQRKRWAKQKSR